MSYLEMIEKFSDTHSVQKKPHVFVPSLEKIPLMKLTELAKRDIAIQIFSEILGCEIWLCSNEEMSSQIEKDNPGAVTYTIDEVMNLIKLKPNPKELRRIHNAKEVFINSKIVDCSLDGEDHDK